MYQQQVYHKQGTAVVQITAVGSRAPRNLSWKVRVTKRGGVGMSKIMMGGRCVQQAELRKSRGGMKCKQRVRVGIKACGWLGRRVSLRGRGAWGKEKLGAAMKSVLQLLLASQGGASDLCTPPAGRNGAARENQCAGWLRAGHT